MAVILKNNAISTLAAGIGAAETSISVKTGEGSLFPNPSPGEWFPVTLIRQDGTLEVCKCTARTSDSLTVSRGQEGTAAISWSAGERIEVRLTAAALIALVQENESVLGDLAIGGDLDIIGALKLGGVSINPVRGADVTELTLTKAAGKLVADDDGAALGTIAMEAWVSSAIASAVAAAKAEASPVGSRKGYTGKTAPAGWIMASGRTIGDATSGATERANADTEALFTLYWTDFSNTELPIYDSAGTLSTRGASAAADFAAHKRMSIPDYRGRTAVGQDNMGGTAAGRLVVTKTGTTTNSSATVTALGSTSDLAVGMAVYGATIPAGVTIASIDSSTQVTLSTGTGVTAGTGSLRFGILDANTIGAAGGSQTHTLTTPQIPAHAHNLDSGGNAYYLMKTTGGSVGLTTGTGLEVSTTATQNAGGGQAHQNVQPSIVEMVIIKL